MIGAIRRRFARSTEEDVWDTDQALNPKTGESSALHAGAPGIHPGVQAAPGYFPGDQSLTDYYTDIVRTAIENGGRYRNHLIPVPWLRMILTGLESGRVDPDLLWYEADGEGHHSHPGIPSYDDLFAPEGRAAARLG